MKRQKKIRQQGLSRRYCQNTRKGSLKPQNMISDIKMSIGKMEKEMVTTKKNTNPFGVLKDQIDIIRKNSRDMEYITRRQNMQKTGFPGGDTVMNKEEIIRREGEDKRKPP